MSCRSCIFCNQESSSLTRTHPKFRQIYSRYGFRWLIQTRRLFLHCIILLPEAVSLQGKHVARQTSTRFPYLSFFGFSKIECFYLLPLHTCWDQKRYLQLEIWMSGKSLFALWKPCVKIFYFSNYNLCHINLMRKQFNWQLRPISGPAGWVIGLFNPSSCVWRRQA